MSTKFMEISFFHNIIGEYGQDDRMTKENGNEK